MIIARFNKEDYNVYFHFKGSRFYEILEVMRSYHLSYDADTKEWYGHPIFLSPVFNSLKDIEPILMSSEDQELVRKYKYDFGPSEIESTGITFNKDLLKYPPILGKPPYENFQIDCTKKGIEKNRFAFFLGMGSGKTKIIIDVINHLWHGGKIDKLFILSPSEGIYNWRRELLQFSNIFTTEDICISSAKRNRNPFEIDCKVIITTYRHYVTMGDDFYKKLHEGKLSKKYRNPCIPWDTWGNSRCMIMDESHNIKNIKSRSYHVNKIHKNYFHYRYLMTGTPTPNTFVEIYPQILTLDSSKLPDNYYTWLCDIANLGNRFSRYAINYTYPEKVKSWEKRFSDIVVRYLSSDILDLPELYVKKIYTELSGIQLKIYQLLIEYVITILKKENDGQLIPKLMINRFPYISIALDNPEILKGKIFPNDSIGLYNAVNRFNFVRDHGKIEIIQSLVEKYIYDEKRKVIIFDYHPVTIESLAKLFSQHNPLTIHGQNKIPKNMSESEYRDTIINEFKTEKSRNLLIASSKVLSTAVNLQESTRAIYFSRDYSFLSWIQSQKRLHRIGQKESVIINPIIFEDSLDIRLDKALEEKNDLDKSLFLKESLKKEEWQKIFKGEL